MTRGRIRALPPIRFFGETSITRAMALVVVIVILVLVPGAPHAAVGYEQPPRDAALFPVPGGPTSQNTFFFQGAFDNFTLPSTTTITDLHWRGFYTEQTLSGVTEPSRRATSFLVTIWSSDTGTPDAVLFSETFALAATSETFVSSGIFGTLGEAFTYDYSGDLANPFVATAGTGYWLSIVANLEFPPFWAWAFADPSATPGDGAHILSSNNVQFTPQSGDLSFALTGPGRAVPEPAG